MEKNNGKIGNNDEKEINKYGETNCNTEFITSYFKWKTLDEQKKRGEELENITNNQKD